MPYLVLYPIAQSHGVYHGYPPPRPPQCSSTEVPGGGLRNAWACSPYRYRPCCPKSSSSRAQVRDWPCSTMSFANCFGLLLAPWLYTRTQHCSPPICRVSLEPRRAATHTVLIRSGLSRVKCSGFTLLTVLVHGTPLLLHGYYFAFVGLPLTPFCLGSDNRTVHAVFLAV